MHVYGLTMRTYLYNQNQLDFLTYIYDRTHKRIAKRIKKKKFQHKIRKHKNYNNECHNVLNKNVPISKCNILPLSVNLLKATNKT